MDLSFVVVQMLTGLASASSLFIIASGLTIVFGVTRIVNFAHGSLYMLGAYFAVTLVPRLLDLSYGPASFWAGILISALAVGLLGVAMEVLLLRRIYRAPELFQLLAPSASCSWCRTSSSASSGRRTSSGRVRLGFARR